MPVDVDGTATISFLAKARKALSRIAGKRDESLGLHPAVYFYSATGAYQPTAFLAAIGFVQELEVRGELPLFIQNRHDFEELLLKYKPFINQIVKHYGSGNRSLVALTRLLRYIFKGAVSGTEESQLVPQLTEDERLAFLTPIVDWDKGVKKDFPSERKSAVYLRQAINTALRCGLCRARVHIRSITIDHDVRKREGGLATIDNGQVVHPYCGNLKQ
jgi:5-methylcytosine-specific restriction endonuclease McrA